MKLSVSLPARRGLTVWAAVVAVAVVAVAVVAPAAAAPPSRDMARLKHENAVLRAKVKQIAAANAKLALKDKMLSARVVALVNRALAADPCPITRPNNSQPPGNTYGSAFHGNGQVWVGLPSKTDIVLWERGPDGSVEEKFGWWHEAKGKLRIEGRRLDAQAPLLRASIPDGYGEMGFQSSIISFPTDGCWQVTGSVGDTNLTFVTLVIGV